MKAKEGRSYSNKKDHWEGFRRELDNYVQQIINKYNDNPADCKN
jgi:hypothetical protein